MSLKKKGISNVHKGSTLGGEEPLCCWPAQARGEGTSFQGQ